jgi:cardiolipin synthase
MEFHNIIENILSYKHLWAILFIAIDVIAIFSLIWRSQGVERTLSWLFAVIAFPGIGAFFYFFLTHQPIKQSKKRKRISKKLIKEYPDSQFDNASNNSENPILNLAYSLTGQEATSDNAIEILTDSENAFDAIEQKVRAAKKFIWVEFYIIKKDETGKAFLSLLAEMASTGIEVRLLYDAYGSFGLDRKSLRKIKNSGGKVVSFNPFNPFRSRWSFHLRNHRKLIVIDGKLAFTGGMNISDEYSGRNRRKGLSYFRDTHLGISGSAVGKLVHVFREDWAYATGGEFLPTAKIPQNIIAGKSTVAILPSDPDQFQNATAMVFFEAMNMARKSICLTSPYFIPDESILRSIECAALRGVDVRIIVPQKSDVILAHQAAVSHYAQLIPVGVNIYEYKPSMLHAKTLIIDNDISIVGSSNMDIRSFRLNFELNALIIDTDIAKILKDKFYSDLQKSKYIDPVSFKKRGFHKRIMERIARLLSPLL